MKAHTEISGDQEGREKTVEQFFKIVKEFDGELRAKLLLFWTGSSKVPVGGFEALANSHRSLEIEVTECSQDLPQAHTCFFRLDLPQYKSLDEMKSKLMWAIQECDEFGFG